MWRSSGWTRGTCSAKVWIWKSWHVGDYPLFEGCSYRGLPIGNSPRLPVIHLDIDYLQSVDGRNIAPAFCTIPLAPCDLILFMSVFATCATISFFWGGPPCGRQMLNIKCWGSGGGGMLQVVQYFSIHCLAFFLFPIFYSTRALLVWGRTALLSLELTHQAHGDLFARHAPDSF